MRLNAISPYYTMFPLRFPLAHLRNATAGDWVLDPFCGRGTTNYAARIRGLGTVGIDVGHVAVATATAKLIDVRPEEVIDTARRALAGPEPIEVPEGPFWDLAYAPATLNGLCRLRAYLRSGPADGSDGMLRAIVLGILHGPRTKGPPTYLSNQMPRTYATKPDAAVRYWRKHNLLPVEVDILAAIERRTRYVLEAQLPKVDGEIIQGDSTRAAALVGHRRFRWIITSPPYYGMRTYGPDQWLRAWFLGGPPNPRYTANDQLPQSSPTAFASALATVWTQLSEVATRDARLIVRFGAIPSVPCDPVAIVRRSIEMTEGLWTIRSIHDAGHAAHGKRQATQFATTSQPVREVDVEALRGTA